MFKKIISFILAVGLLGMTGCSSGAEKEDVMDIYIQKSENKISQYELDFKNKYPDTEYKITYFSNFEEMDEKISTELNSNAGPDIIIFSALSTLDLYSMAENGALKDLSTYIENDETLNPDDYLKGTFEAGKIHDKIYALPLTVSIPLIFFDGDKFGDTSVIYFDEFQTAISDETANLKDDDGNMSLLPIPVTSATSGFFDILEIDENGDYTYNDEELKTVKDFLKLNIYDEFDKFENLMNKYGAMPVDLAKRFVYNYNSCFDLCYDLWGQEAIYNAANIDFNFSAIKSFDGKNLYADAGSYAVITENANDNAFDFIRTALDCNAYSGVENKLYGLSPNLSNIDLQLDKYKTSSMDYNNQGENITSSGLSENSVKKAKEIIDSVTAINILNFNLEVDIYFNSFKGYFWNEKTYDECYTDFTNKFNLYMNE